jgi:hypothetical protein
MAKPNITRRSMIGGVAAGVGVAAAVPSGDIVGAAGAQSAAKTFALIPRVILWRLVLAAGVGPS